jgi:hypothetical protein
VRRLVAMGQFLESFAWFFRRQSILLATTSCGFLPVPDQELGLMIDGLPFGEGFFHRYSMHPADESTNRSSHTAKTCAQTMACVRLR